jgi:ERCC4-related helicase
LVKTNYLRGSVPLAETKLRHLPQINILLLPEYARLIKRYVHTVSLSDPNVRDVIKIPERVDEYIACEPHSDHVAEYLAKIRSIKDKVLAMREHKSMMALSLLNPLLELSSFPSTPTIPNIKLDRTLELCEAVKGKTAIFVTRVKTGRELFNTLKTTYGDKGVIRLYAKDDQVKPAILSHEKREDIVNEFLFNPKIKVGVFSILLASESIDLNQVEQVIFYGYPWSSLDVIQALFRAVRPGNPYPQVQVKFLYNRGMIDEHQLTLLSEGSKASKALLNFDPNSTLIDGDYLIKNTLNL